MFHDVRFPIGISLGAQGGPERRTDVVVLGSGREERNARWADSRRRYNAGYGVRSLNDLHDVIAFFEARRARLYAFRWRDPMDWKSCAPTASPSPTDVEIAIGDGATDTFDLVKPYGSAGAMWSRRIDKPNAADVRVAVDGVEVAAGQAFTVDASTGRVVFASGHVPDVGEVITAGFTFDVPARFDTDTLDISLDGIGHGSIPNIPIVEVRV